MDALSLTKDPQDGQAKEPPGETNMAPQEEQVPMPSSRPAPHTGHRDTASSDRGSSLILFNLNGDPMSLVVVPSLPLTAYFRWQSGQHSTRSKQDLWNVLLWQYAYSDSLLILPKHIPQTISDCSLSVTMIRGRPRRTSSLPTGPRNRASFLMNPSRPELARSPSRG
jgi:hypothetical protein